MASLSINAFLASLSSSLQSSGSETVFYLDKITTLTGESIATTDFSIFGRGTITIDPLSSTDIEFASFTGVNATNLSLTGGVRGLSAKGNTSSTSRMPYHAVGTPVIISFGVHNLEDLKTYIDGLVAGTIGNASSTIAGVTKLSINPVSPTSPIAVGDNDTRVPTQGENDALVGSTGTPSSSNRYVTESGLPTDRSSDFGQTQTTQDSTTTIGEANATTKRNKIAQSFIPVFTKIRGVALYKSADTGTFTGTVTVSLQADAPGSPSGSSLASLTITNAQWLKIATGEFTAGFTAEYTMTAGSTYWIVVSTSTSDNSNHPNLGINTVGGYANGGLKYNNTTDGWATTTTDLYFKTLNGIIATSLKTDATTGVLPTTVIPNGIIDTSVVTTSASAGSNATVTASIYAKLLPQDFFQTNSGFKIKLSCTVSVTGGNSVAQNNVRIYLNSTQIFSATLASTAAGTAYAGSSNFEMLVINNNSKSSQRIIYTFLTISGVAIKGIDSSLTTSSFDTSAGATLEIVYEAVGGDLGGATMTNRSIIIEKISL